MQEGDDQIAAIAYSPESILQPLSFATMFKRATPVEVDLGCGDGAFLVRLAECFPDRSYLGIERMRGRATSACKRAAGLENVRVLQMELSYAANYLLPACSIDAFHLLFPDPWPKRRHHVRRVVTAEFIRAIHRALVPTGTWHIATDDEPYFQRIAALTLGDSLFESSSPIPCPPTTFERRFGGKKLPIYRLLLRKISPVQCARASHPFPLKITVTAPV